MIVSHEARAGDELRHPRSGAARCLTAGQASRRCGSGILQSQLLRGELHRAETAGEYEQHGRNDSRELGGDTAAFALFSTLAAFSAAIVVTAVIASTAFTVTAAVARAACSACSPVSPRN